jgi:3-oxoadipate enol-lactonase
MIMANVNGIELAYERRGSGMPMVLIHGYPLDHTIWDPVAPLLEKHFDLILPDLRGFGQSGTVPTPYLLADMAADIAALLDFFKIEKAAIVGHSMGGYIALAFARVYPGRLLGLGLIASQTLADSPEKKAGRYQEAEHILANGVREVAEDMSLKLTDDTLLQARLKELMLRQRPEGMAGALCAMAGRLDSTDIIPTFDFPVVLVHGLADKLIPIERLRSLQALLKHGTLVEIERAGHMPMMESPQVTAEALKTLL